MQLSKHYRYRVVQHIDRIEEQHCLPLFLFIKLGIEKPSDFDDIDEISDTLAALREVRTILTTDADELEQQEPINRRLFNKVYSTALNEINTAIINLEEQGHRINDQKIVYADDVINTNQPTSDEQAMIQFILRVQQSNQQQ